jgi:hypothetical protein
VARQKRRKEWTACVHCGQPGDRFTRDHVPPKGLFDDKRNLLGVPSCSACNNGADKDEEYFRAMMLPHHRVHDHPEAQKLLPTLWRSLERPDHKGMARGIVGSFKLKDIYSPITGLGLGRHPTYRPNERRMNHVIRKIIRGLYWHHFGKLPLPPDWDVWVCWQHHFPEAKAQPSHANVVRALQNSPPLTLGNGVFTYSSARAADVAEGTIWLLKFYDAIEFFCATIQKDNLSAAYVQRTT